MRYKIAQLSLTAGNKAKSISEIFVAQPNSEKESLAGKLFILIEIESTDAGSVKLINFIINELENNYYKNEKIILREKIKSLKVEHIFESSLAKTNKNLSEFIRSERIKINTDSINAIVGVIHENMLHFTSLGKNKALLIYKSSDKSGEAKYKITDIIKRAKSSGGNKQTSPAKLFTNVISGSIPKNGYFLFTNEALPEYLSSGQLIGIIAKLPPAGAVEQIKNTLNKINAYVSFLGILIKNCPNSDPDRLEEENLIPRSSQSSIEGLNATEETTEKLLAASGAMSFKKWLNFLNKLLEKIKIHGSFGQPKDSLIRGEILAKRKDNVLPLKKILKTIKNIFVYSGKFTIYLFKIITDREKASAAWRLCENTEKKSAAAARGAGRRVIAWFKSLNKKNKALIIIAAACLILLSQNIIILNLKNKEIASEQEYADLTQLIEKKQNQAEASLLYGNEESAKKILEEISGLLGQMPQKTEEQINKFNGYKNKYERQLEKIRRVVRVESPVELADFSNLNSGANPTSIIISYNQNKIYAGDGGQKSIYTLDLEDNIITAIAEIGQGIDSLDYPVMDKDNNIYYLDNSGMIKINGETEETSKLSVDFKSGRGGIKGADTYNNRLYFLNAADNQIYRHDISKNNIGGSYSWLTEKADLAEAVGISIDGHVYVLKNNGELQKYLKGQGEDFNLDKPEPEIKNAQKLFVSPDLKHIYIMEPSEKRLIIFDKTGKFLLQYQSDEFNELKDFAVNEAGRKIYLLNGTSIYEIEGTHFEE